MHSAMGHARRPGPFQALVAAPGVVDVLGSVVAGATAGIALLAAGSGTAAVIIVGAVVFCCSLASFALLGVRTIESGRGSLVIRFPSSLPPALSPSKRCNSPETSGRRGSIETGPCAHDRLERRTIVRRVELGPGTFREE